MNLSKMAKDQAEGQTPTKVASLEPPTSGTTAAAIGD